MEKRKNFPRGFFNPLSFFLIYIKCHTVSLLKTMPRGRSKEKGRKGNRNLAHASNNNKKSVKISYAARVSFFECVCLAFFFLK